MSRACVRWRWVALYALYACLVASSANAQQLLQDNDCIGNSPGCVPTACNGYSVIFPGYSCEEVTPIPYKICATYYGKSCQQKIRNCGQGDMYSGNNVCQNGKCVNAIYTTTLFKTANDGC